jgi:hypothetical protein
MTLSRVFTFPLNRNDNGSSFAHHFGDCMVCVVQEAK